MKKQNRIRAKGAVRKLMKASKRMRNAIDKQDYIEQINELNISENKIK